MKKRFYENSFHQCVCKKAYKINKNIEHNNIITICFPTLLWQTVFHETQHRAAKRVKKSKKKKNYLPTLKRVTFWRKPSWRTFCFFLICSHRSVYFLHSYAKLTVSSGPVTDYLRAEIASSNMRTVEHWF